MENSKPCLWGDAHGREQYTYLNLKGATDRRTWRRLRRGFGAANLFAPIYPYPLRTCRYPVP